MKYTLLEIVKKVLHVMDSEDVNSLQDSEEAKQIASLVEDVYWDLVANRKIPEHEELCKLVSLADNTKPTYFRYPDNVREITRVFYNQGTPAEPDYVEVYWKDPMDFFAVHKDIQEDYLVVEDPISSVYLKVMNNKFPQYFTSFDDQYIVMDAYDDTVETTLQESKTLCYVHKYPTFEVDNDEFIPDLDDHLFPLLLRESQSMALDLYKGGTTAKVEQAAKRNKNASQDKRYHSPRPNNWNDFGRG